MNPTKTKSEARIPLFENNLNRDLTKAGLKNIGERDFAYIILNIYRKQGKSVQFYRYIGLHALNAIYKETLQRFKYGLEPVVSMDSINPTEKHVHKIVESINYYAGNTKIVDSNDKALLVNKVYKEFDESVLRRIFFKMAVTKEDRVGLLREQYILQELNNKSSKYKHVSKGLAERERGHITIITPNKYFRITILFAYQRKIFIESLKTGELFEIGGYISTTSLKQVYETFTDFAQNCKIKEEKDYLIDLADIIHRALTFRY